MLTQSSIVIRLTSLDSRLEIPNGRFIMTVAYGAKGEQLAAGAVDGTVTLFDTRTSR